MAWIPMIPEDEAEGELKEWYDRLRDPWGGVDDIMRIHSISLPTMKGHYELYKSAMTGNPDLSRKEREMSLLWCPRSINAITEWCITERDSVRSPEMANS